MPNVSPSELVLLTAATANNSVPSGNGAGVAIPKYWDAASLFIWSTAGTTPNAKFRLWGWLKQGTAGTGLWFPMGPDPTGAGDESLAGYLNGSITINPYTGNTVRWTEVIQGLSVFDRVYLEMLAVAGTSAAFSAVLRRRKVEG